jgi:hypothetical protein
MGDKNLGLRLADTGSVTAKLKQNYRMPAISCLCTHYEASFYGQWCAELVMGYVRFGGLPTIGVRGLCYVPVDILK